MNTIIIMIVKNLEFHLSMRLLLSLLLLLLLSLTSGSSVNRLEWMELDDSWQTLALRSDAYESIYFKLGVIAITPDEIRFCDVNLHSKLQDVRKWKLISPQKFQSIWMMTLGPLLQHVSLILYSSTWFVWWRFEGDNLRSFEGGRGGGGRGMAWKPLNICLQFGMFEPMFLMLDMTIFAVDFKE